MAQLSTLGHTTRMKRLIGILLVVAFAIFAIADIIHDFIANDAAHYFSEQPHRLILVAVIGIVGGLLIFAFYQLSPRLQRRAKLLTLGLAASFVTMSFGWFLYRAADFSFAGGHALILALLSICTVAALLWIEFYLVYRKRIGIL